MSWARNFGTAIVCAAACATGAAAAANQAQQARVDAIFAKFDDTTPGCAVGVEQDGRTLLAKGYGAADLAGKHPLTPQTRFYMASVSKQFTAMAILLLVEDGRLRLDDPVRKIIPELPAYADGVTVRHLLNHDSGIRDFFTLGSLSGIDDGHAYTEADVLGLVNRQEGLDFEPGTDHLYSNSGYVLLSMIVQRVSGQRLDDFARARIFTPLGMANSRFQHDHLNPIQDKANGYDRRGESWAVDNSNLDVVGDGGLYSTIDDMLHWSANFDSLKVGAKSVPLMRESARLKDGSPTGYGMGLAPSTYLGLPLVSHGGALAGYRTDVWWFPRQRLGIVLLCNRGDARTADYAGQVAAVFLEKEMKPATAQTSAAPVAVDSRYAGLYRDTTGSYSEFALADGQLVTVRPPQPLVQIAPGTFAYRSNPDGPRLIFGKDAASLQIVEDGERPRRAARVEKSDLTGEAGADFVGTYSSREIPMPLTIKQGTQLALAMGGQPDLPLVSTGKDRLWVPAAGGELVFTRDPAGKINGFVMNAGRARGIKYSRTAP